MESTLNKKIQLQAVSLAQALEQLKEAFRIKTAKSHDVSDLLVSVDDILKE